MKTRSTDNNRTISINQWEKKMSSEHDGAHHHYRGPVQHWLCDGKSTNPRPVKRGRLLAGIAIGLLVLSGAARPAVATDPPITVDGAGNSETHENQTIETTGDNEYGAQASNGGEIILNNSSITTSGLMAPGLYSLFGGSTITATDVLINTSGDQSFGVQALYGGQVSLGNANIASTITTTGSAAVGIYAAGIDGNGTPSSVSGYGLEINTSGDQSYGVQAQNGGQVFLSHSVISTGVDIATTGTGTAAHGIYAVGVDDNGKPSLVAADNVVISTSGDQSFGVAAQNGGQVSLSYYDIVNTIITTGTAAHGIYAAGVDDNGNPSLVTGSVVSISTSGDQSVGVEAGYGGRVGTQDSPLTYVGITTAGVAAHGVEAQYGGQVFLGNNYTNDGSISIATTGLGAFGLYAAGGDDKGTPALISLESLNVDTSGDASHGLVAEGFAEIDLANSTVTTHGAGAALIFSRSFESLSPGSDTGTSTVNLKNSSLISELGDGIVVTGNGAASPVSTLTVNLTTSHLVSTTGAWLVAETAGGNTAAVTVTADNSYMEGFARTDADSTTDVTLQNVSLWAVTGSSNLTKLTNNASKVAFAVPASTDNPALLSSYKTLTVGDYTGTGGIIGLNTYLGGDGSPSDRLVIDGGAATGNSFLYITTTGGLGALSTGNGILVVDTTGGGTTATDAFTLYGRVVGGPFEYSLYRGGVGADAGNDNWYLRSGAYRPEVGSYLANQRMAGDLLVHSLHDRLGGPQWLEQQDKDEPRDSLWLRLVGKDISSTSKNGVFDVSGDQYLLQGGGDIAEWSEFSDNDRIHLGAMVGLSSGSNSASAQNNAAKSDGNIQGVSIGLYGTWFQKDDTHLGWYADLWGQYGWFSNRVKGDSLPEVKYDSRALALSAEAGYAHQVAFNGLVIEPQAQLIYASNEQDDVTEQNGTRVTGDDGSGWMSRLGVRLHRTWVNNSGSHVQPYLTLNWWHDATSNAVALNQVSIGDLYPQDRGEIKFGANAEWGGGWSGWANVGGQWGGQDYRAYIGRIGVKLSW